MKEDSSRGVGKEREGSNAPSEGVLSCIEDELRAMGPDQSIRRDAGFSTYLARRDMLLLHLSSVMRELYWRARKCMSCFETFRMLCQHNVVSPNALQLPIDYYSSSQRAVSASCIFGLFRSVLDSVDNPPPEFGEFSGACKWLSAVIGRSSVNQVPLVDLIERSQLLGPLDTEAVRATAEDSKADRHRFPDRREGSKCAFLDMPFDPKPDDLAPVNPARHRSVGVFGMILPSMGCTNEEIQNPVKIYEKLCLRFNRIERAFKEYFMQNCRYLLTAKNRVACSFS